MYCDKEILVSDMILLKGDNGTANIVKYSIIDKSRTLIAEEFLKNRIFSI